MNRSLMCECGCGQPIQDNPNRRKPARFLPGHHVRLAAQEGRPPKKPYVPTPEEIPSGICECGCGKSPTAIAKATERKRRHFRGHPIPYLHGHGSRTHGPEHHLWRGGRFIDSNGYVMVYAPDHSQADRRGYMKEHRLVMERHLGRMLEPGEVVHHKSGVKDDNRLENLELMTRCDHSAHHGAGPKNYTEDGLRRMREGGRKGAAMRWGKELLP